MSSVSYFVGFLIILGWEGALCAYMGVIHESTMEVVVGAVFTVILWGLFGWWALLDTFNILAKKILR
jgi:hypothetical protein